MSSAPHTKKPSYFKTLPDEIVKSPTGVTKIPNSRFPTIAPLNPTTYKSVYERAGFEVYKPKGSSSKRSSQSSGLRSASASHVSSEPPTTALMQKQNKSDAAFVLKNRSVTGPAGDHMTSDVKPGLSIDAKLANSTFQRSPMSAQSTPLHSSITVTSTATSAISSNSISPDRSAPNSAKSQSFDVGKVTSGRVPERANTDDLSRSQVNLGSTASLHTENSRPQSSPRETRLNPYVIARSHEQQPISTYEHTDESLIRDVSNSNMNLEESPLCDTLDVSDDELNLSSDGFDDESMCSNVLSPMPQAQLSPTNSLVESPVKLRMSASPDVPQHAIGIPTFTVSPPMDDTELSSPSNYYKTRASGVSVAASSIYSNEFLPQNHEGFVPPLPDLGENFNAIQNQDDQTNVNYNRRVLFDEQEKSPEMTASAFKDIEKELGDLSVNSSSLRNLQNNLHSTDYDISRAQRDPQFQMGNSNDSARPASLEILPVSKSHVQNLNSSELAVSQELTIQGEEKPSEVAHSIHKGEISQNSYDQRPLRSQSVHLTKSNVSHLANGEQRSLEGPQVRAALHEEERPSDVSLSFLENEKRQSQIRHPPGEGPCRKCSLPVTKKPIYSKSGELSGQWHRDCFTCTLCEIRFNKTIPCFVLNDLPYCEFHYHVTNHSLCQVCGKGIVGECLENDTGDRYHINCLSCTQCQRKIEEDYMSIDEKVYCEQCAADFTTINATRSTKIERRRTRLFFI